MNTPFARSAFRKSKFSEPNQNCVEVAQGADVVEVRDSKTAFGSAADARIRVSSVGFSAFLDLIRGGGEA